MSITLLAPLVAIFVAGGVLLMLETGRRVGLRRRQQGLEPGGGGAIEGAVFAIFGLLVAFTFSGAASRFDDRRALITQEANNIGTAWLRLDLLPTETQPAIRDDMRRYVDARLATYKTPHDLASVAAGLARSNELQGEIWSKAVAACRADSVPSTTTLVLPSLNEMFDIATTRLMSTRHHPPTVIFVLLVGMSLVCAFLAGTGLAQDKPNRLHALGFAVVIAITVFVIIDLEFPRLGFIRVDAADQILYDVRASMGQISAL